MSAESKKIYEEMDNYLRHMRKQCRTPGSIAVTKKQFQALKDAWQKKQAKLKNARMKDAQFPAEHNGISIQIYSP